MEKNYKTTEKAYKEILELVSKYKDSTVFNYNELLGKSSKHLFGIKLKEEYGLDITPEDVHSTDYLTFGDYRAIGWWGDKYRRTVSWSDDGKQPVDELLLCISFPTGAYIFGDDYPQELFQEFFQELKSYQPKYTDTTNKCLYFSIENAKDVFNKFQEILKSYCDKNKTASKERKIKKLQEELAKLTTP